MKAEIDQIEHPAEVRSVLRRAGRFDPADIDGYLADGGYSGLKKALAMNPEDLIKEMRRSCLRGRGGLGFPVAEKWRACRDAPAGEKGVICNAAETDSTSSAGRVLLEKDPHAVLEGLLIGALTIGANLGIIVINPTFERERERLRAAIEAAEALGLIGDRVLGSAFSFRVDVREASAGLIGGEETVLIRHLEGEPPLPAARSPWQSQACSLVNGHTALIHHIETWAHVSAVLEMGANRHAGLGVEGNRGTKIFTLSGDIGHHRVVEVPLGTSIRRIVFEIGGGAPEGKQIRAVRFGGPAGGFLPADALDIPATHEHLEQAGVGLGSGGLVAVDDGACLVDLARGALTIMREETCGVCVFGREAIAQMAEILDDIGGGRGELQDIDLLIELAEGLKLGALCPVCPAAAGPVLTGLKYFRPEYKAHVQGKRCPAGVCAGLGT